MGAAQKTVVATVLAAGITVGLAVTLASEPPADRTVARADSTVTRLMSEVDDLRRKLAERDTGGDAAAPPGVAESNAIDQSQKKTTRSKATGDRRSQVEGVSARLELAVAKGDGDGVLRLLRELAQLLPESKGVLMTSLVDIEPRFRSIGISNPAWDAFLAHPPVRAMQVWSIKDVTSPPRFRELAAWTLPWQLESAAAARLFSDALARETDVDVVRALIRGLSVLRTADARNTLVAAARDAKSKERVRTLAIGGLVGSGDREVARTLAEIAANDASPRIRDAAHAARLGGNPPASGYLVLGLRKWGRGWRMGLRPGDIITRYDGTPLDGKVAGHQYHRVLSGSSATERVVPVEVFRDGTTLTLQTQTGWLGVDGAQVGKP